MEKWKNGKMEKWKICFTTLENKTILMDKTHFIKS